VTDNSTAADEITVVVGVRHAEGWCTKLGIPMQYAVNLVPLLEALYSSVVIDVGDVEHGVDDPKSFPTT
jgi:hypothetical protein